MAATFFHRHPQALRLLLISLGCGALLISGIFGKQTYNFKKTATSVSGEVVQIAAQLDTRSRTYLYTPIVRFLAADGKMYTTKSSSRRTKALYTVGETVPILYVSTDPTQARINRWSELWLGPLIAGIIGSGFIVIGFMANRLRKGQIDGGADPPKI